MLVRLIIVACFLMACPVVSVFPQQKMLHKSSDTLTVRRLLDSAGRHLKNRKLDSAKVQYRHAHQLATEYRDHKKVIEAIAGITSVLRSESKFKESLSYARESLRLSQQLKDTALILEAMIRTGAQYFHLNDYKNATSVWVRGLQLAEKANDSLRQLHLTSNLSAVFLSLNDNKKSLYYTRKAYALSKQQRDTVSTIIALGNLADSEGVNGDFSAEMKYRQEVVRLSILSGNYRYLITAYLNMGVLSKKKREFKQSLDYYLKALAVAEKHAIHDYNTYTLMAIAEGLENLGRNAEGLVFARKAMKLAEQTGSPDQRSKAYEITSNILENLGSHKASLDYFRKGRKIKDSLVERETEQEVNRMELQYASVKKEKEIADQKLVISGNKLELQKKNGYILLSSLAVVFLTFVAFFVYFIYKSKYRLVRKEKDMAILEAMISGEEKERSRLALNLHDGIGGILSVAKMQVDALSREYPALSGSPVYHKTLAILNTASHEARSMAHDLAPQVLFHEGLEAAIAMFCERTSNSNLEISHYMIGKIGRFHMDFELFIYRAVQEGISNIIKHARARKVLVQLSKSAGVLSLTIEDDGVGTDLSRIGTGGMGLSNLISRTFAKGGIFELTSEPGSGTTIYLEFETAHLEEDKVSISNVSMETRT